MSGFGTAFSPFKRPWINLHLSTPCKLNKTHSNVPAELLPLVLKPRGVLHCGGFTVVNLPFFCGVVSKYFLVGGFNPYEKYARQNGNLSHNRGEHKTYLKPPPSFGRNFMNRQHLEPYTPGKWTNVTWKGTISKGNYIFQPSIFRGHVSFQGGIIINVQLMPFSS